MSLFVPTWHSEKAGVNVPTASPGKPGKGLTGLSGEESRGIYPRIPPAAAPTLPGRAERPCLACGRQCPEGILFETDTCFEAWKARRTRATSPQAARTATGPARSIPHETSPEGGTA